MRAASLPGGCLRFHSETLELVCFYSGTGLVHETYSGKGYSEAAKLTFCSLSCVTRNRWTSQVVLVVKNPPANAGDVRHRFDPWGGKIPQRRAWKPTPVFLPGESHGQRSLEGYSTWGHRIRHDWSDLASRNRKTMWTWSLCWPDLLSPIPHVGTPSNRPSFLKKIFFVCTRP